MPVPSFDEFIEPLLHYLAERSDGVDTDDGWGRQTEIKVEESPLRLAHPPLVAQLAPRVM